MPLFSFKSRFLSVREVACFFKSRFTYIGTSLQQTYIGDRIRGSQAILLHAPVQATGFPTHSLLPAPAIMDAPNFFICE